MTTGAIEEAIENLFYKMITDMGHVRTGLMRDSMSVTTTRNGAELEFSVTSTDYFPIVDDRYGISDAVFSSAGWSKIEDMIGELIAEEIEAQINDDIDSANQKINDIKWQ